MTRIVDVNDGAFGEAAYCHHRHHLDEHSTNFDTCPHSICTAARDALVPPSSAPSAVIDQLRLSANPDDWARADALAARQQENEDNTCGADAAVVAIAGTSETPERQAERGDYPKCPACAAGRHCWGCMCCTLDPRFRQIACAPEVETLKQKLIDETGAALWENWLPILDALILAAVARGQQEIAKLTEQRDTYRTLAGIGTWHSDCRPNRHMAAREIEKSQAVINKLADEITTLQAQLRLKSSEGKDGQ